MLLATCYLLPAKAQCPQFYDSNGNLSSNPYWVSCSGTSYTLSLQSPSNFSYTGINWGDGTTSGGGSYTSPAKITHTYSVTIDTFVVQIATGGCTVQGVVVMEKPVNAAIQIPTGGPLASCAPKVLQFINSSTNVSQTTHFIWSFGDGTSNQTFNYQNAGDTVNHLYSAGTVSCQTSIQLSAYNYCTYGVHTIDNYSPIKIYDKDAVKITTTYTTQCFPDKAFTFTNSTTRNCLGSGNVTQRYDKWNFGNNWGKGQDSIINWQTWPPAFPVSVTFPDSGNYTVMLIDSSLCGIDTARLVVSVVHKPRSLITVATNTVCQGLPITFTNGSTPLEGYKWNFGAGAGLQILPSGNETKTYTTAGSYTVSLITFVPGNNAYCTDTFNLPITVKPNPVSNFVFTPTLGCNNTLVAFADSSKGVISGWNWNFGNGNTYNLQNHVPAQSYTSTGTYTVSLITQSTSGCRDTIHKTFQVYPAPAANFSVNTTCTGYQAHFTNSSTFSPSDTITAYNWNFGDGSPTIHAVNPVYSYTAANTYTVSLNVVTAHCDSTKTVSLLVNQTPTASYTPSGYTVCPNTTISFTNQSVNASTYTWTFGSLGVSDSTNPVKVYSNGTQSVTTYPTKLVAVSAQGCKDSVSQIITVNPRPNTQFTTPYFTSCAPIQITFSNTTVSDTTVSYLWNFGDGTTYTHTDTTHLYNDTIGIPKTFSVNLVATNVYNCSNAFQSSYVVYPQAIYNFTPTVSIGCSPLAATFHTDSGAVSYIWDFVGNNNLSFGSYTQPHTFVNLSSANDTLHVKLYTNNPYNCKDTSYGTVIVLPSPKSQFAANPPSGCTPLHVNFNNNSSGTIAGYKWYFSDSTTYTSPIPPSKIYNDTTSAIINAPVSLVVAGTNGCTDSSAIDILLYPAANYSFTVSKDTGCSVFDVTFTSVSTTTILASYAWNLGDNSPSQSGGSITHNYSTTSLLGETFTITMNAKSQYGCVDSMSKTIFVYPQPTASLTPSIYSGCSPLGVNFTNHSVGSLTNLWYFGDSLADTSHLVTPLTHTYQNTGSSPQNFSASLVVTGLHGCKDSASQIITVNPMPVFGYQLLPDSGCSPLPVNFILVPVNFSPNSATYLWHFGDSTTSSSPNPNHTYINTTNSTVTYSASLTTTNSYGCANTVDSLVTVFSVPTASVTVGPSVQTYPAATISFINFSQGGFTYNWNLGDGTQKDSAFISPHTYATWGTYIISFKVSNAHCSDSTKQSITIKPPIPIASFIGSGTGCQPLVVTFTNTSTYASSYLWNFGDGNFSIDTSKIFTWTYNTPGIFPVSLTASGNNNSSTFIKTDSIIVYQKPTAYFTANPLLVYIPTESVSFNNQSQNAISYNWDFGDGGLSTETNPQHVYYIGGDYPVTLIATSLNNCTDTFTLGSTIKALISSSVQVPNAFTPNPNGPSGNGIFDPTALNNFIFHPVLTGIVQYDLTVYNKWGELLFETTDQKVGWDGYYKNKMCEEDTYVYKIYAITVESQIIQKTGSVALFR